MSWWGHSFQRGKQLHATELCFQINNVMGISVEKVYSLFESVIHPAQFPVKEFQPKDVGKKTNIPA